MRHDHLCINVKRGEIDEVIAFYEKLGFVVYKTSPLHAARGLTGYGLEHKTDRSLKIDVNETDVEPYPGPFNHWGILVDDVQQVYEDLKEKGIDFGDANPPALMPSGRILLTFKGPNGMTIQFSDEMRKKNYISDYDITEGKKEKEKEG